MKTTLTLQKIILTRIKTQGLKPMPKGYFRVREYILWGLMGLFVTALSIGCGMIIFMIKGADMTLFGKLGLSVPEKIIYAIPSFWIIVTVIVALIAFLNFRNTRRGYRTSVHQFVFISALVAVGLGSITYTFRVSEFVDKTAAENIPLYNTVVPLNTNTWLDPAHGLLSGVVRSRENDTDFKLRDSEGVLWHVTGDDVEMEHGFIFSVGDRVRLIGTPGDELDTFIVREIIPWK